MNFIDFVIRGLKISVGLLSVCIFTASFKAQAPNDVSNSFIYNGRHTINRQWSVSGTVRYENFQFPVGQAWLVLSGLGFSYRLKGLPLTLAVGYTHSNVHRYKKAKKVKGSEDRIFQQATLKKELGPLRLFHRFRIEERWAGNNTFQFRMKYRLLATIPFSGKNSRNNSWYGVLYDEIRMATQGNFFQTNKIYAGLGYKFNEHFALESGWESQFNIPAKFNTHQAILILRHDF